MLLPKIVTHLISFMSIPKDRFAKDALLICRPCVYTAAMLVNNRALMPCQEFGALSTWQAFVRAPIDAAVLMSSDNSPTFITSESGAPLICM